MLSLNFSDMRILVIEDEPVSAIMLRRLLVRDGHNVVVAGTGDDAVDKASLHLPELVISDFLLPGTLNGAEASSQILKRVPTARVIIMSSQPLDIVAPQCAQVKPIAILEKPVEYKSISRLIDEMGGQP
jgi:CheY-like chemotaxis protein